MEKPNAGDFKLAWKLMKSNADVIVLASDIASYRLECIAAHKAREAVQKFEQSMREPT